MPFANLRNRQCPLLRRASAPWLAALAVLVCIIWGNSLVPGEGSGSLSLTVLEIAQGALRAAGLPYAWLTNFIVRKAAHFSEYAVLGIVALNAWRPHKACRGEEDAARSAAAATVATLVLVPLCDEGIQRFVPGRCGQLSDVAIDCAGAAFGALAALLVARVATRVRQRCAQ